MIMWNPIESPDLPISVSSPRFSGHSQHHCGGRSRLYRLLRRLRKVEHGRCDVRRGLGRQQWAEAAWPGLAISIDQTNHFNRSNKPQIEVFFSWPKCSIPWKFGRKKALFCRFTNQTFGFYKEILGWLLKEASKKWIWPSKYSELLKLNDFNEMSVPAARTQLLKLTNVASSLCLAS